MCRGRRERAGNKTRIVRESDTQKREYEIRVYVCECEEFRLSDFCMCDAD